MKKIISLSLALIMLIGIALPNVAVRAEENANENEPVVATEQQDGQSAEGTEAKEADANKEANEVKPLSDPEEGNVVTFSDPQPVDVTDKVTVSNPNIILRGSTPENDKSLISAEGKLIKNPTEIGENAKIGIIYTWEIKNVEGIKEGDFFIVPLPDLTLLRAAGFKPDVKVPITSGSEVLGEFVVDTNVPHIKAFLNKTAADKKAITDGLFTLDFTATKYLNIETTPAEAVVTTGNLKITERKVQLGKMGGNPMGTLPEFRKTGEARDMSGEYVIRWDLEVNREELKNYLQGGAFNEKRNVWIEDRMSQPDMRVVENQIIIYPSAYVATEDGKVSTSVFYTPNFKAKKGELPAEALARVTNYETFKEEVKKLQDINPFTVFVYKARQEIPGDRDGVLFYFGNITEADAVSYDKVMPNYRADFLTTIKNRHSEGRISDSQLQKTKELYGLGQDENAEMKKVIGAVVCIPTRQSTRGTFNNKATMSYDGATPLESANSSFYALATGQAGYIDTISIAVEKKWASTPAGKMVPVVIKLKKNGADFKQVKLGAAEAKIVSENEVEVTEWEYTFANLPTEENTTGGKVKLTYTAEEVEVPGFTKSEAKVGNIYTFTNTYNKPADVVYHVTKEWVGPATGVVHFNLVKENRNNEVAQSIELPVGTLQGSFPAVPVSDDQGDITYKVVELAPANSVQVGEPVYTDATKTYAFKNRNTEKVNYTIKKEWIGAAPDQLTVFLEINGVRSQDPAHTYHLAPNAHPDYNWQAQITDLPKYDEKGQLIVYSGGEDIANLGHFTFISAEKLAEMTILKNRNDEKMSIPVTKKWFGPEAGNVVVQLLADNKVVDGKEITLGENGEWTKSFTDLRVYDEKDGHPIVYSVQEKVVPVNYSAQVVKNDNNDVRKGFTITNTNNETVTIPVIKKWVGPKLQAVEVELLKNGKPTGMTKELNEANNWESSFADLRVYDAKEGNHPFVYTIRETVAPVNHAVSYDQDYKTNADQKLIVTNRNIEKININVEKKWVHSSQASAFVVLLADGKEDGEYIELNAANNWKHTFEKKFRYDQTTGLEIKYEVKEREIPNFRGDISGDKTSGFVVTNTYLPPIPPYVPSEPETPTTPDKPEDPKGNNAPEPNKPEEPNKPNTPTDVVPDNPTPQGEPNKPNNNTPSTPNVPQTPDVQVEEVPENKIPQGNRELPKTDGIPASMAFVFGIGLVGLGLFFKKED